MREDALAQLDQNCQKADAFKNYNTVLKGAALAGPCKRIPGSCVRVESNQLPPRLDRAIDPKLIRFSEPECPLRKMSAYDPKRTSHCSNKLRINNSHCYLWSN